MLDLPLDCIEKTGWRYSGARVAAETDASGNIVSLFVYGTSALSPDYMVKDGVTYRFIRDFAGSVRLVVDADTGAIAQRMDYDSFGNVSQDTNPGFQPFGFKSGLYDPETGLVHFGARWYDPATGRWLSKDPILLAGGLNLYIFCGNDPVNFADPQGLWRTGAATTGTNDLSEVYLNHVITMTYDELQGKPRWQVLFDTDFYDGDKADVYWNYRGNTYRGDDINYLGIGMYDAAKGNSVEWSKFKAFLWKLQYGGLPNEDVIKWLEFGYNKYNDMKKAEETIDSILKLLEK